MKILAAIGAVLLLVGLLAMAYSGSVEGDSVSAGGVACGTIDNSVFDAVRDDPYAGGELVGSGAADACLAALSDQIDETSMWWLIGFLSIIGGVGGLLLAGVAAFRR